MAYADHSQSSSRFVSIVIVALIHAVLGYVFVSGLGIKYVKKAAEQLNVIDVKDEPPPPPEEPPPPPPDQPVPPPPVYIPPPQVQIAAPSAPSLPSTPVLPPPLPPAPTAPPAPPPPPAPKQAATPAKPRGAPGDWVGENDMPSHYLRERKAGVIGVTGFALEVDPTGRPSGCQVTSSSGEGELDSLACDRLMKRARFSPAQDDQGNKVGYTYKSRVRWQITGN